MLVIIALAVVAVLAVSLVIWALRARKAKPEEHFVLRPAHDAPPAPTGVMRPDQPGFADAVVASVDVVGIADTSRVFGISEKRVLRLRVVAGKAEKSCASCEHWDYAEGQRFLAENPIVRAVTGALTPDALGARDGKNKQNWTEFGACTKFGVGMSGTDWCGREVHTARFKDKGGESWA